MRALILLAGIAAIFLVAAGLIALFSNMSDRKALRTKRDARHVKHYRLLLAQIEDECRSQLMVDQYDLTAHRVQDLIRKTQRSLDR